MSENTRGMTAGERIAHVGGRVNEDGTVTFGSPMAVAAMLHHLADDMKVAANIAYGGRACGKSWPNNDG